MFDCGYREGQIKNIYIIFNREDREELSRGVVEGLWSSLLLAVAEVSEKDLYRFTVIVVLV
jgi:hypothetical protein